MIATPSRLLFCGALFGFIGVFLGAFGAHRLAPILQERGMVEVWRTAVLYQFLHALALILVSREERAPGWIGMAFAGGTLLFSGSLYLLAFGAPRWVGAITPLGGLGFLAGWFGLMAYAWRRK